MLLVIVYGNVFVKLKVRFTMDVSSLYLHCGWLDCSAMAVEFSWTYDQFRPSLKVSVKPTRNEKLDRTKLIPIQESILIRRLTYLSSYLFYIQFVIFLRRGGGRETLYAGIINMYPLFLNQERVRVILALYLQSNECAI